ncbi:WbqC family protein [Thauera sp. WH-1]|uniref:WbqC family protein n=1 Tax=Thauera sp. WH-1 TaxID=3398230 RepID=UPI0039FD174C
MKTIVALQSNYIPWKGYFDLIHDADVFIYYDDVQYTKNDWRNRNKIKTPTGATWLTIPTGSAIKSRICEIELPNSTWQIKHWKSISQNYSQCPYFKDYKDFFAQIYLDRQWKNLSELNQFLISNISKLILGIETEFLDSRNFNLKGSKQDRLLDLLSQAQATEYISGPAGRSYIDENEFFKAGISLKWKDYQGYPEYSQRHPPFDHNVTILDLIFNTGPEASYYIWGWRNHSTKK